MRMTARTLIATAAGTAVFIAAGCAPGGSGTDTSAEATQITEPVTAEQVADLGEATLTVWADAGEESMLEDLIPLYEDTYPNVTVDVTYKGWDDLMGTVVNAMASNDPPDVTNGNQGFATMGTMVAGGMIRPLDDFVDAYGLKDGVPETGFGSYSWNEDGTQWGTGEIVGVGGATQPIGLFYNTTKLDELGIEAPETIADLESALAAAKDSGEVPIQLGNSEQYPLGSHLLGLLIDMYASPDEVNDWIAGGDDATFDTPGVQQAVETLAEWGDAGYFPKGYDGKSLDDAVADFGEGEGVFFLGGSFNGAKLADYSTDGFGFALLQGDSGTYVTTGTFGTPWHISSTTDLEPAALAFLGMMLSTDFAQSYADNNRLPNYGLSDVEATGSMHAAQLEAARAFFDNGDFVGYLDWATPTMQQTLGAGAQELLATRVSSSEFIERVQADWAAYQEERASS